MVLAKDTQYYVYKKCVYIINIIIILKIFTLSYNLGEGNIRCNRLITNMGEVFSLCEISFFNSHLYYICQINNINKTYNYTFTPVHFFSFCCGQKEKKPNQRKEKHAVAWTRAIKDGYRFILANSPPAQTHFEFST